MTFARIQLVLALSLSTFGLLACQAQPADAPAPEAPTAEHAQIAPAATPSEADLPAALIGHLDNMATLGVPLTEFCPEMTEDLTTYFEKVEPLFASAKASAFDEQQRAALTASYDKLSAVAGRCLSVAEGRSFSMRLVKAVRPLIDG